MTQSACARLVEQGDPDRFRAVLAARPDLRGDLFTLYAFNLEVARAPWVTTEPMIAEMRLQWWRDVAAEPTPRAHEVAGPFHTLIAAHDLPVPVIDRLIAARLWEVWREPFADAAALWDYLAASSGGLALLAARISGSAGQDDDLFRDHGRASGLAHFLAAVPALIAHGLSPLPDPSPAGVRALAHEAAAVLARTTPRINRLARPQREAMFAHWQARPLLALAAARPELVITPGIALSPFRQGAGLVWRAFTGRI